jgi:hypothetical protein
MIATNHIRILVRRPVAAADIEARVRRLIAMNQSETLVRARFE